MTETPSVDGATTDVPAAAPSHVAVLGAGPIGLEAGLAAWERGWPFTIYEAGANVGAAVDEWEHVRLFTPWEMNVSRRMRERLSAHGLPLPTHPEYPTGAGLRADLLDRLAALPELDDHLALSTRVLDVGRSGLLKHEEIASRERGQRPFRLLVRGPDGAQRVDGADVVLDCTGTYGNANSLGDGGIPVPGEQELGARIRRTLPDFERERDEWIRKTVLLVGAGKSAQTAARDLAALVEACPDTRVIWAVRHVEPDWGAVPDDALAERQALVEVSDRLARGATSGVQVRAGVTVDSLQDEAGRVRVSLRGADGTEELAVDRVLALTGYVPDASFYRQLQVQECYATAAPMQLSLALLEDDSLDCLQQRSHGVDTLRHPEPNFFILGMKSYGRNSQFLLRNGYDQVEEVAGAYPAAAERISPAATSGTVR